MKGEEKLPKMLLLSSTPEGEKLWSSLLKHPNDVEGKEKDGAISLLSKPSVLTLRPFRKFKRISCDCNCWLVLLLRLFDLCFCFSGDTGCATACLPWAHV